MGVLVATGVAVASGVLVGGGGWSAAAAARFDVNGHGNSFRILRGYQLTKNPTGLAIIYDLPPGAIAASNGAKGLAGLR